ncbi:2-dehydropantoate 2-reductase [Clostridiaceae bacterium 35-E11]
MKIAVLGAGAMGCLYGGMLAEADNEVWLLDVWKEHVDAINETGLYIETSKGNKHIKNIRAAMKPSDIGVVDLVLVFVKSTITEIAIEQNKEIFGIDTIALTLQNGLGNIEKIGSVIGKKNIIAGTTAHGSTMLGPGKIRHAGVGKTHIGEIDGSVSARIQKIGKVFSDASIATDISENVMGLVWGKLMVNIGINALTAITGLKNGQLIDFKETEELLELAVAEAWHVAKIKGIQLPYDDPIAHTKEVCKATAENRSSMLQDVVNKRKTEIEMINGAIVREGEVLGLDTPINKVITNLIAVIQKKYS